MTLLIRRNAEVRIIRLESVRIEAKVEIAAVEGPQWVVQEIVPGKAKLQPRGLTGPETLKDSKIPVEEARSVNGRVNDRSILADAGGHGKTICINVLVLPEV